MAMMEKINKNPSGEIIDKSSRPRNFNRNNFYSRDRNRNTTHTWPANNNNRQPMKSMQCFKCGRKYLSFLLLNKKTLCLRQNFQMYEICIKVK